MRLPAVALALVAAAAALTGCKPSQAAAPAAAPPAASATAAMLAPQPAAQPAAAQPAAQPPAKQTVSRIVFIDKEKACECTQKAIDASWTALQSALGGAAVPVERIHMDTQEAFAAGYREKKPMVAVPGIYFLADGGAVVELLQGTVTAEQVKKALQ